MCATWLAHAEIVDDGETAEAIAAFLQRAVAWVAARGVRIRRVMAGSGPGYLSRAYAQVCRSLGLRQLPTRP